MDEEMNGGGGERRCAGMGEEPTDSDTEGTVAGTMEAEGDAALALALALRWLALA